MMHLYRFVFLLSLSLNISFITSIKIYKNDTIAFFGDSIPFSGETFLNGEGFLSQLQPLIKAHTGNDIETSGCYRHFDLLLFIENENIDHLLFHLKPTILILMITDDIVAQLLRIWLDNDEIKRSDTVKCSNNDCSEYEDIAYQLIQPIRKHIETMISNIVQHLPSCRIIFTLPLPGVHDPPPGKTISYSLNTESAIREEAILECLMVMLKQLTFDYSPPPTFSDRNQDNDQEQEQNDDDKNENKTKKNDEDIDEDEHKDQNPGHHKDMNHYHTTYQHSTHKIELLDIGYSMKRIRERLIEKNIEEQKENGMLTVSMFLKHSSNDHLHALSSLDHAILAYNFAMSFFLQADADADADADTAEVDKHMKAIIENLERKLLNVNIDMEMKQVLAWHVETNQDIEKHYIKKLNLVKQLQIDDFTETLHKDKTIIGDFVLERNNNKREIEIEIAESNKNIQEKAVINEVKKKQQRSKVNPKAQQDRKRKGKRRSNIHKEL
jgi:hypothetical protein